MKKIGIIAAMQEEYDVIKELMENIKIEKYFNLELTSGEIVNKQIVLVKCGIGKVNAARVTQILIDKFDIEYIVNVGVAGSLNDELEIGDIVIGKNLVQHDFDITPWGHEKGYINKEVGRTLESSEELIEKCKKIITEDLKDINVKIGTIATGDIFCTSESLKDEVAKEFGADCIEMEGASIAQVCKLSNTPFIVIRSISDKPNGKNHIAFDDFLDMSVRRYQKLIKFLIWSSFWGHFQKTGKLGTPTGCILK